MRCECGGKTRVITTRDAIRRRECLSCGLRFYTREVRGENIKMPSRYVSKKSKINWNNPFGL